MKKLPFLLIGFVGLLNSLSYADDHPINTASGAIDLNADALKTGTISITDPGSVTAVGTSAIFSTNSAGTGIWTVTSEGDITSDVASAIGFQNIDTTTITFSDDANISAPDSIGVLINTAKGDISITNQDNASIVGDINGVQISSIKGSTTINNTENAKITGTTDDGIRLVATQGNVEINNQDNTATGNAIISGSSSNTNASAIFSENFAMPYSEISIKNSNGAWLLGNNAINLKKHQKVTIINEGLENQLFSITLMETSGDAIVVAETEGDVSISNTAEENGSVPFIQSSAGSGIQLTNNKGAIDITNNSPCTPSLCGIEAGANGINISNTIGIGGAITIDNNNHTRISSGDSAIKSINTATTQPFTLNNLAGSQIISQGTNTTFGIALENHTSTTIKNDGSSSIASIGNSISSSITDSTNSNFTLENTDSSQITSSLAGGISLSDHGQILITNNHSTIQSEQTGISSLTSTVSGITTSLIINNENTSRIESNVATAILTTNQNSIAITNDKSTISGSNGGIQAFGTGNGGVLISQMDADGLGIAAIQSGGGFGINIGNTIGSTEISNTGGCLILGDSFGIQTTSPISQGSFLLTNDGGSRVTGSNGRAISLENNASVNITNSNSSLITGDEYGIFYDSTFSQGNTTIKNTSSSNIVATTDAINLSNTPNTGFLSLMNDDSSTIEGATGLGVSIGGYNGINIINNNTSRIRGVTGGIGITADTGTINITNANGASIEGTSGTFGTGINIDHNGTLADVVRINNLSTIIGNAGAAIQFNGTAKNEVNLYSGSVLTTNALTIIGGVASPTSEDTVNLFGKGPLIQNGNIVSIETLNMNGDKWSLNGNSTIEKVNVNTGELTLNGSLSLANTAHLTEVFSGATLKGDASINGNLTVNSGGFHKPGNSISTQNIAGTYTLRGTLEVEIDASTPDTDLIIAGTKADISGATLDNQVISGSVSDGQKFKFLQTPTLVADASTVTVPVAGLDCDLYDGVTTTCFGFTQITNPIFNFNKQTLRAEISGPNVALYILSTKKTLVGILQGIGYTDEAGLQLAANIDLVATPNNALGQLKSDLILGNPNDLATLMTQATPRILGDLGFISNLNQAQISRLIVEHANDLRLHNPPVRPTTVWAQPFLDFHRRDNQGSITGLHAETYGVALGVDHFPCDNHFNIGGVLGFASSNVDWKLNRGNADINGIFWGGYSAWKDIDESHNGYHIDASLVMGHHFYDVKRNVPLLGLVAKNEHSAWSLDLRLGGGYVFGSKDGMLEPYAYADYLYSQERGYVENGAGALNQSIKKRVEDTIRIEAGANFSKDYTLCNGWVFAPKLNIGWVSSNPIKDQNIKAGFLNQVGFSVKSFERSVNQLGVGMSALFIYDENLFLSANYNTEIGRLQYTHRGSLKASYRF